MFLPLRSGDPPSGEGLPPEAAGTLDVRGAVCPHPMTLIKIALEGLEEGAILEGLTDHASTAQEGLPRYCRTRALPFDVSRRNGHWRFRITKRAGEPPATLVAEGLSKAFPAPFGRVHALTDIHLEVREHEFLCLLGPSGCGKSTLLALLAGLERPDGGTVRMNGRPIEGPGPDRLLIFQDGALFPWLTVRQNVEFGLLERGASPEERRRVADEYLDLVHLQGFRDAYVHQLSGGMRQRVALARGLVLDPEILLMDEPFAALDAQSREHLHRELLGIWKYARKTIVFVTHNVQEAVLLGDRVVVLTANPGRIKKEFPIPLGRPRRMDHPQAMDLLRRVGDALKGEVGKVFREEIGAPGGPPEEGAP